MKLLRQDCNNWKKPSSDEDNGGPHMDDKLNSNKEIIAGESYGLESTIPSVYLKMKLVLILLWHNIAFSEPNPIVFTESLGGLHFIWKTVMEILGSYRCRNIPGYWLL